MLCVYSIKKVWPSSKINFILDDLDERISLMIVIDYIIAEVMSWRRELQRDVFIADMEVGIHGRLKQTLTVMTTIE